MKKQRVDFFILDKKYLCIVEDGYSYEVSKAMSIKSIRNLIKKDFPDREFVDNVIRITDLQTKKEKFVYL